MKTIIFFLLFNNKFIFCSSFNRLSRTYYFKNKLKRNAEVKGWNDHIIINVWRPYFIYENLRYYMKLDSKHLETKEHKNTYSVERYHVGPLQKSFSRTSSLILSIQILWSNEIIIIWQDDLYFDLWKHFFMW